MPSDRLLHNHFLTIPFQSGNIITSSIEILDENTPEFLHSHLEYEVYYCLKGCLHLRVENDILTLNPYDFVLLKPNIVHGVIDEPNLKKEYFICIFQPTQVQIKDAPASERAFFSTLRRTLGNSSFIFQTDKLDVAKLICEVERVYLSHAFAWELIFRNLILNLLIRLLQNFPITKEIQTYSTPENENIAVTIDRYIHNNYQNNITLEDAALAVHMTPRNVNRVLQKYYGKSFQKCLIIIRLGSAKKYLIETNYSIEKIAELVGLSPQSLFRIFRQVENLNPNEYRQRYRGK